MVYICLESSHADDLHLCRSDRTKKTSHNLLRANAVEDHQHIPLSDVICSGPTERADAESKLAINITLSKSS
eukprot:6179910-Pleurochrysis_carterae.AAC.6